MGCSGFSYTAWSGHFYPPELPKNKLLTYYSSVFDFVEIDSTFYRTPNVLTTTKWAKSTPENFKFTAKMPSAVTHDKRLGEGIDTSLRYFYAAMRSLKDKLAAILIQLPPSMTKDEGFKKLKTMPLDERLRHALEARHESWFDDEVCDFLRQNNICLVWSQRDEIATPPVVTADFVYLRLIGDRSISEDEFTKIHINRLGEMQYWASELKKVEKNSALKVGIVAANNHYAGFGPGTSNTFRKLIGLPESIYRELEQSKQPNLLDY